MEADSTYTRHWRNITMRRPGYGPACGDIMNPRFLIFGGFVGLGEALLITLEGNVLDPS
jgi:hypothetical protein